MMTRHYDVDEPHGTDDAALECQDEAIRLHALCDSHETGDNELMSDVGVRTGKPASAGESESVSDFPFLVISSLAFGLSVAVVAMASLFGTANVKTAAGNAAHVKLLKPFESRNIDLGRIAGVAFYTVEQENYRLVIGLQALESGTPLRVVTTLAPEQRVTLAVPQADNEHAVEAHFVRHGEMVNVDATSLARRPGAPTD
jgi:hypothetical protein